MVLTLINSVVAHNKLQNVDTQIATIQQYERTRKDTDYKPSGKLVTIPEITKKHRTPTAGQPVRPSPTPTLTQQADTVTVGEASFYTNEYCKKYNPSCRTASGEIFDDSQFTVACSSRFSLGSTLSVTYGDESILVRCNDRGSFEGKYHRILDLSKASFEALAPLSKGHITVQVKVVQ